jgi:hypothetical protein
VSRNEDITTAIWEEPEFADLPPDGKLLFIWSFTNEHNNMSGLYKVRQATIAYETGLTVEGLTVALAAVAEAQLAWHEEHVMLVRSRVKRLRTKSPQIAISIARAVTQINAEHPLRLRFLEIYGAEKWLRDAFKVAKLVSPSRTHGEVHENTDSISDSLSLTRASSEAPLSWDVGQGLGTEDEGSGEKGTQTSKIDLPKGFPEDRRPHLRAVYRVLRDLAARNQGAKAVNPVSLANVIMGRPPKAFVVAAFDYAAWADDQPTPRINVVAGYRNWLDKTPDMASLEALDVDGRLTGAPATNGTRGQSRVETSAEMLARRDRERQAREQRTAA